MVMSRVSYDDRVALQKCLLLLAATANAGEMVDQGSSGSHRMDRKGYWPKLVPCGFMVLSTKPRRLVGLDRPSSYALLVKSYVWSWRLPR